MTTRKTLRSLGALSARWLKRSFFFRRRAVAQLVRTSGYSEKMAHSLLEALFSELTAPKLKTLVSSEITTPDALDGFVKDVRARRFVRAKAPSSILHIFSSNIPSAAVTSFVIGLLVGSRNTGKVSRRDPGILSLYLDSLKSHDRDLWKRCRLVQSRAETSRHLQDADLVVAYGNDESLAAIRETVPAKTPFIGYGHRVSFALVLQEALGKKGALRLARKTAYDVWMADQRGCLSPVIVFVQKGGQTPADGFASLVAMELERLEKSEHSTPQRAFSDRNAMKRLEDAIKIERLKGKRAQLWKSTNGSWMVGYDERLVAEFSSASQILRVKGFGKLSDLERIFQKMKFWLQGASLECDPAHRKQLAEWLGLFGVNRVCRAGQMQKPPITWHHDGRYNFANWLSWIDLEN